MYKNLDKIRLYISHQVSTLCLFKEEKKARGSSLGSDLRLPEKGQEPELGVMQALTFLSRRDSGLEGVSSLTCRLVHRSDDWSYPRNATQQFLALLALVTGTVQNKSVGHAFYVSHCCYRC